MVIELNRKSLIIAWRIRHDQRLIDLRGLPRPQFTRCIVWCFGWTPSYNAVECV